MRRSERIYDAVEPVEEYRPGGYHPVHVHDLFNQRYEVIGKLAYGQFPRYGLRVTESEYHPGKIMCSQAHTLE